MYLPRSRLPLDVKRPLRKIYRTKIKKTMINHQMKMKMTQKEMKMKM
jgi:hypothetical protein